jgi:pilus assembly protein Flp/PilA
MRAIIVTSKRFISDESGATALEYGLIAGLISLAVVTGATAAGTAVNTIFTAIGTKLAAAATAITG